MLHVLGDCETFDDNGTASAKNCAACSGCTKNPGAVAPGSGTFRHSNLVLFLIVIIVILMLYSMSKKGE